MNRIRSLTEKTWAYSLFVGVVTFAIMFLFLFNPLFISDEVEIFNKGQCIAQGQILYKDIGSQHMPVMYFIAALFALVGVGETIVFRLCFHLLFAALWALIAYRYRPRFGRWLPLITPVLYLTILPSISTGTTILSEQMQAIAMVILCFELLQFRTDRPLTIGSCVMISLAVLISFGSAFVSIFAIFAVGVTVAVLEILAWIKEKRGFFKEIGYLFSRYWKLVLIVAAPFAVMLLYFALNNALLDFYGWAYTINRVIYPKYLGGYGSSILGSMFFGINYVLEPITNFMTAPFHLSVMRVGYLLLAIIGLQYIYRKTKSPALIGGLVFFFITASTRGVFNFHGLAGAAIVAFLSSFAVTATIFYFLRVDTKKMLKRGVVLLAAVVMMTPFFLQITQFASNIKLRIRNNEHMSDAIDVLTEEGEGVGFSLYDYPLLVDSKTVPASVTGGSCPWLWEFGGEQAMEELTSAPPRVFLFDINLATWNYAITDYAQDLVSFINDNYQSLEPYGYNTLYVHNDYFDEAVTLLNIDVNAPVADEPTDDSTVSE